MRGSGIYNRQQIRRVESQKRMQSARRAFPKPKRYTRGFAFKRGSHWGGDLSSKRSKRSLLEARPQQAKLSPSFGALTAACRKLRNTTLTSRGRKVAHRAPTYGRILGGAPAWSSILYRRKSFLRRGRSPGELQVGAQTLKISRASSGGELWIC